jgi:coenzyme F420-reducing hydrogenase beta subunit
MIDNNQKLCSGCGSCAQSCPRKAINMETDPLGCLSASVNTKLCIDCGKCDQKCHLRDGVVVKNHPRACYLFVHNDDTVLRKSTSGGAFTALSDVVLSEKGVIFGTRFDRELNAEIVEATNKEQRDHMRGSLYLQSSSYNSFALVKERLKENIPVLFIGTPCQVAGLKCFLGELANANNLYTVDFICHGVPSNSFFKSHIEFLKRKYSVNIVDYTFRDKKYAWFSHGIEEAICENGRILSNTYVQTYNYFFQCNVSLRESCFECRYRGTERVSDLTIADFWGVEKIDNKKHRRGASLVTVNTEKGKKIFNKIADASIVSIEPEKVMYRFKSDKIRSTISREDFFEQYTTSGYEGLIKQYPKCLRGGLDFCSKKLLRRIISKVGLREL